MLCALASTEVFAQTARNDKPVTVPVKNLGRVEITAQGGYRFGGGAEWSDGSVSLNSGPATGGMIGVRVRGNALALAGYHYQFSRASVHFDRSGTEDTEFDMGVGYLQFGGEIEFPVAAKVAPFMGMTLGTVHFTPDREGAATDWFFAGALFGGVKVRLLKHFGLRADFKLLVTVLDNDSRSMCIEDNGCVTEIDVNATAQGEFVGGMYFAF